MRSVWGTCGRIESNAGQKEERRGFGQTHPLACLILMKEYCKWGIVIICLFPVNSVYVSV